MSDETRYDEDTVDLVARTIVEGQGDRWTEYADDPELRENYLGGALELAGKVLDALADAGLLIMPGGEMREGQGFQPAPYVVDANGRTWIETWVEVE